MLSPRPFTACYILVDGIDELGSTAADWDQAAALVEPLAANLSLMDLPGVAFRFFLPAEKQARLQLREAVRRSHHFPRLGLDRTGPGRSAAQAIAGLQRLPIQSLDQISRMRYAVAG